MSRKIVIGLAAVLAVAVAVAAVAVYVIVDRDTDGASAFGTASALPGLLPPATLTTDQRVETLAEAVAARTLAPAVVAELRTKGTADVFVWFVAPSPPTNLRSAAMKRYWSTLQVQESRALASVEDEVEELTEYRTLPFAHVQIDSERALVELLNRADVARVNGVGRGTFATNDSLPLIGQPAAQAEGNRGANTLVAVLDTGVDYNRPGAREAFGNCTAPNTPATCRIAVAGEYAQVPDNVLDDDGHGTNVAGIVAAVAPDAKIIAMDVFGAQGAPESADYSDIAKAIEAVVLMKRNGQNVSALNLSLGEPGSYHLTGATCRSGAAGGEEVAKALETAWSAGIVPVVAAGNDAWDAEQNTYREGISHPACARHAVRVGAVYDANVGSIDAGCKDPTTAQDQVTCFSQTGQELSLLAPGAMITAAGIQLGGTSQAAPHVAGAVAVLAAVRPSASPDQIVQALTSTGTEVVDSRMGHAITKRRLDLPAAVAALIQAVDGGGDADETPPAVEVPVESFDGRISDKDVIVKVSWSATDPSGVTEYGLEVRTDGGTWAPQSLSSAAATEARFLLSFGSTYELRVRAKDGAGNWSDYVSGPELAPALLDDKSLELEPDTWTTYSSPDVVGGTAVTSSRAADEITLTAIGRDLAVFGPRFSTAGRMLVYCDGELRDTVDLQNAVPQPRELAYWCSWTEVGERTMRIVVEGTLGRPQVDVDAFAVLR